MIEGRNYSSGIAIDSFESIFFRLQRVLVYLNKNYPQENWSKFIDGQGILIPSQITWSGHSDGAGHAAVIAKYYSVGRVVCFSGPKDFSLHYYLPPVWMHTGEWKTDKSKLFVFAHTGDEYTFQKEIWDSLGLNKYGLPINVGSNAPPYKSSHQLITSVSVSIADIHGSTILDSRSPKVLGNYVFEPVWRYLLDMESTTAIKAQVFKYIKVFPNPVHPGEELKIDTPFKIQNLEFLDCTGKKIHKITGACFTLEPQLSSGVYFIRGMVNQQTLIAPIVVY